MKDSKIIIVSNRLPVKVEVKNQEWVYHNSEGGLATGLGSIYKENSDNIWIGWPGTCIEDEKISNIIKQDLIAQNLYPVMLSQEEIDHFYDGFSNDTLWPLFHYFPSYANYTIEGWNAYRKVNRKFAEAVLSIAQPNDTIWIHDYQLMLVPQLIRDVMPDVSIGFFQHIPFPSYEVFRLIPWREKLLKGLLGADLIGFHTYDDARHFMSATTRIIDAQSNANEIIADDRTLVVDAFPMGIDYDKYRESVFNNKTKRNEHKLHQLMGDKKLMISIDRLDYSKGIPQRLLAYDLFLKTWPEFKEKVIFIQLVVPSRDTVKQYASLKEEINRLVSDINAKYGTLSWQPIHYFYRSFPLEMLSALYAAADIALVTPLRDGMNLVCKEYIASKIDKCGVLILSEMAGASKELYEALIINPTNTAAVAEAIHQALIMPEEEQMRRMESMQLTVEKFNIQHWVNNFMDRLKESKQKQKQLSTRIITEQFESVLQSNYATAEKRLIFLDYDGTLVPFNPDPLLAKPDEELNKLLQQLYEDEQNIVVIISGRKKETLEKWVGDMPIDIIAEHGAWMRKHNEDWAIASDLSKEWKNDFLPLLRQFEMRTPGSFVEEKDYSLAWHYRKVDKELGGLRAKEITGNLKYAAADMGLQLIEGNKVIEIKSANINKGNAAKEWIKRYPSDFILAIGDDFTDEDTFKAMPEGAVTIKVGPGMSSATYFLKNPAAVRRLLDRLHNGHNNSQGEDVDEPFSTGIIKN
jgi:trehalose 6-phosphate synthase/phosphatase